jgi:hypothetical protein
VPADETERSRRSWRDSTYGWWNRITKTIVSIGALAAAIAGIVSVLPDSNPDPADIAQLTSVRIAPQVRLSEYEQRSASASSEGSQAPQRAHDIPAQMAGLLQAGPTTSSPTVSDADTTAPETSSSDTTAPETSSSDTAVSSTTTSSLTSTSASSTTEAPPSSDVAVLSRTLPFAIPPPLQDEDPRQRIRRVLDDAVAEDPSLSPYRAERAGGSAMNVLALAQLASTAKGEGGAPEDAAKRLVALLRDARRADTQGPGGELAEGEPLGVVVSADIELIGLRNRSVMLSWSMWQQGGQARLYGEWLNTNLAYVLEATTDDESKTVDLWVPLPKEPGPYYIRLVLTAGQSALDSADSDPFT